MKSHYIYVWLICAALLCGCRSPEYNNRKPDDNISGAIYEAIGDELYYLGKNESVNSNICYEYLIRNGGKERRDVLNDIVFVVNETIEQEKIIDNVDVVLYHERPGGMGQCVRISNYSSDGGEFVKYEGMQILIISGFSDECIYNDPSVYVTLPNIKRLRIDAKIQEKADFAGIDWHDCWKELESVELFASNTYPDGKMPDDIISSAIQEAVGYEVFYLGKAADLDCELGYKYHIREKNSDISEFAKTIGAVVVAANNAIEENNIMDLVSIRFYWYGVSGKEENVLTLCNYSDDKLKIADLNGLERVIILGGNYKEFRYNRPEIYESLPNIKYLEVKEHIQEKAAVDWYEYWPELESIKLLASDEFPDGKMPDDAISRAIKEAVNEKLLYCGKSDIYRPRPELCYEYYIKDECEDSSELANLLANVVCTVNETIVEENIQEFVSIYFYYGYSDGIVEDLVLHLYNYSEYQLEYPDLNGLERVIISGSSDKNSLYDNPQIYGLLPNIKYLEVKEHIQKNAIEKGMDWYDYWKELKTIEVFK